MPVRSPFLGGLALVSQERPFPRVGGHRPAHPLPGSEVIFGSAPPSQGRGLSPCGDRPTTSLAPWPPARRSRGTRSPRMAPVPGGVFMRKRKGGLGVHKIRGSYPGGPAALPPPTAPRRLKAPSLQAPGTHPRLSLSETTRLPLAGWLCPSLAGSAPPQGGRPAAFFPADSTCTNIHWTALSSWDRDSMETSAPTPGTLGCT